MDPCVIVKFIKNPTKYNVSNFIIPYVYEAQHVSDDTPPIIRSLKLYWKPAVFYTWKVVGRVVSRRCRAHYARQRPPTTRPTTFHVWITGGCQCSFRLLMMGGMSLETCWASCKYEIIKFDTLVASRCRAHYARQRPPTTRPTTFHIWKTGGCQYSFRLLMMGGMSFETCWASYKYEIIKFDTLLHLGGFFFMNFITFLTL